VFSNQHSRPSSQFPRLLAAALSNNKVKTEIPKSVKYSDISLFNANKERLA
jgi:hypothetical protein